MSHSTCDRGQSVHARAALARVLRREPRARLRRSRQVRTRRAGVRRAPRTRRPRRHCVTTWRSSVRPRAASARSHVRSSRRRARLGVHRSRRPRPRASSRSGKPSGISYTPGRATAPETVTSVEPGSSSVPSPRNQCAPKRAMSARCASVSAFCTSVGRPRDATLERARGHERGLRLAAVEPAHQRGLLAGDVAARRGFEPHRHRVVRGARLARSMARRQTVRCSASRPVRRTR